MDTYTEYRARRTFHARRTAVVLIIGAVTGCVGLVQAGVASAEALPRVTVTVDGNDTNPKAHWGQAWDACQKEAPNTRSIHYMGTFTVRNESGGTKYVQEWECDDQP